MNDEQLKFHSERCITLKYISLFVLLGGIAAAVSVAAAVGDWAFPIGLVMTVGAFVLIQNRAERHWDVFMDGAEGRLGKTHPLIEFGRRL